MSERKAKVFIVDAPSDRRAASAMMHARSREVAKIYLTSGQNSPGGLLAQNCPDVEIQVLPVRYDDPEGILTAAQEIQPDLVEVGQEDAIFLGVTDLLRKNKFDTFGVSQKAGRFEWDKVYARRQMLRAGARAHLPHFQEFRSPESGLTFVKKRFQVRGYSGPLFLKAAFPALGKGSFRIASIKDFEVAIVKLQELPNNAGRIFLIENGVGGPHAEEFSGFWKGSRFAPFGYYQDHKNVFDGDEGPMGGGSGSVGPISLITPEIHSRIEKDIISPFASLLKRANLDMRGDLYFGGMYDPDDDQFWNIEFNMRNGGSEASGNLAGIKNDYFEMNRMVARGEDKVNPLTIEHDGKVRVSAAGMALGYPDDTSAVLGKKVEGLEEVIKKGEVRVLGAAIEDDYRVSGGRIFWMVAEGDTVGEAMDLVNNNMDRVWIRGNNPGENLLFSRHDIGGKERKRQAQRV